MNSNVTKLCSAGEQCDWAKLPSCDRQPRGCFWVSFPHLLSNIFSLTPPANNFLGLESNIDNKEYNLHTAFPSNHQQPLAPTHVGPRRPCHMVKHRSRKCYHVQGKLRRQGISNYGTRRMQLMRLKYSELGQMRLPQPPAWTSSQLLAFRYQKKRYAAL
jgi:hypothetical protein